MNDAPPLAHAARPRLWSALSVTTLGLLAGVILAGIVQVAGLFSVGAFAGGNKNFDVLGATGKLLEKPWGPAALILPSQLTMLAAAIVAALLSPLRLAPRLGYTRSVLPWRSLPLLVGGTFFAAGLGSLLAESLFADPGLSMRLIFDMMQKAKGPGLIILIFLLCILPPLGEEVLFRGYLQRRLLQRWPPALAIAVSTLFFVLAHFDPVHVVAVIPLGVWLGVVAWRCDSIWPAMLCHGAQNSFAFWVTRHSDPLQKGVPTWQLVGLLISGILAARAVVVMRRHPVPGRQLTAVPPTIP